jgi:di/tricarboxylate transporter
MTITIAISLAVLVLIFVVATVLRTNIGTLAFASAFVVGIVVAGLAPDKLLEAFPVDLFVLLTGVTYLFAIAQNNGTVDWIAQVCLKLVRGNLAVAPFTFALIGLILGAIGVYPPAAVAVVAPVALSFADRYNVSQLLVGVMLIHGVLAGAFSPIGVGGILVNGTLQSRDIPTFPMELFVENLAVNCLFMVAAYLTLGGIGLLRHERQTIRSTGAELAVTSGFASGAVSSRGTGAPGQVGSSSREDGRLDRYQTATLVGILLFIVLAVGFGFDVGLTAFAVGAVLTVLFPGREGEAIRRMPWSVVLLVTGILTYVGVLQSVGALEYISNLIASTGSALLTTLLVSFVSGLSSFFASTSGILVATLPVLISALQQVGVTDFAGAVTALAVASNVVDISPLSTAGATLLATARNVDENAFFRRLLAWGIAMIFLGALIPWLLFVTIPTLV